MQDRFKFRAWQKNYQKMYYDVEMTYDYPCEPRGAEQSSFGDVLENDDYVLMQCTGLKDKNGKLIYEGDILKTKEHNLCKEGELFKVFYQETLCQFLGKSLTTDNCIDLCDLYEDEVIGNIYENPKLLED